MTTKSEVQSLLRFLSQDAKLPLATAMSKIKELQTAKLTTPTTLSQTSLPTLERLFPSTDEGRKQAKSILLAAKRVSRKATSQSSTSPTSNSLSSKRARTKTQTQNPFLPSPPATIEASLALPTIDDEAEDLERTLHETVIITNRAPFFLAFAVTLLKYTQPAQPLSSRLSLAQAVVSLNSRSKAISIGLADEKDTKGELDWLAGQPSVTIMGRQVKVLRRYGYDPHDTGDGDGEGQGVKTDPDAASQETLKHSSPTSPTTAAGIDPTPLWAIDVLALQDQQQQQQKHNPSPHDQTSTTTPFPIHQPTSARSYLLKSFASAPSPSSPQSKPSPTKPTAARLAHEEKTHNLALLLTALDLLFSSWCPNTASQTDSSAAAIRDLDKKAWGWYVATRPDVAQGAAGWGSKGEVKLGGILDLRRGE